MRIVYRNIDESVGIIIPIFECLSVHGLRQIALKDVPAGLPFWLVKENEIPSDRTFREAWEIPREWGNPDGYGSEYNTFEEIEDAQDKQ
ncbi:MAG: hypothetical protein VB088_02110 [Sphaerochaeta sp.]|nr:hypothetical protein [Sphaerochaeta sp.]